MSLGKFTILSLCAILLLSFNAAAQKASVNLSGTVSKFYGEVVPNARITIKLKSKKPKFTKTVLSNSAGAYRFTNIPSGIYEIFVTDANGLTYENPNFDASKNQSLNIKIEYGGDCLNSGSQLIELNEKNQAEIITLILKDVLSKNKIAEYDLLMRQKDVVVLSNENINAEWLKPLKKIKFNLLSKAEIRKKAEDNGAFLYLSFKEFKAKGNCVVAAISNLWAIPFNSKNAPLNGGGNVYIFKRNKSGKLSVKAISRWRF